MNNGYIAEDVPIDIQTNETVLFLKIKTVGCWKIIEKKQLKLYVCNNNIDTLINCIIIFQVRMTPENGSSTDYAAMKWETSSNCSAQDSWITFYNTNDELEYETFVGRML